MKNILIVVGILIVLTASFFIFSSRKDQSSRTDDMQKNQSLSTASEASTDSKYIEYSSGILEKTLGGRRILFFFANWCPTCRPVDKEISQNTDRILEGIVIIRVNYNDDATDKEEEALAKKYGITYQHTFIEIDSGGEEVQSWNGGDLSIILSKITK